MIDDREIRRVVGGGAFERGRGYATEGRVTGVSWDAESGILTGAVRGSGRRAYTTTVRLAALPEGGRRVVATGCSCPVALECKHVAALLLTGSAAIPAADSSPTSAWQRALDTALKPVPTEGARVEVALQFELIESARTRYSSVVLPPFRLGVRPVSLGKSGRWVRSEVTWRELSFQRDTRRFDSNQFQILSSLQTLGQASSGHGYYAPAEQWVYLDDVRGPQLWRLLRDAVDAGVPLIHSTGDADPVRLAADPIEAALDLRATDGDIDVVPWFSSGGETLDPHCLRMIGGTEPTGAYWWSESDDQTFAPKARRVTLAPFAAPVSAELLALYSANERMHIPEKESALFLAGYFPRLAARMPVVSSNASLDLPEPPHPVLQLRVSAAAAELSIELRWNWMYRTASSGDGARLPLLPPPGERAYRNPVDEQRILSALDATPGDDGGGHPGVDPRMSGARSTLTGRAAVDFVANTLPYLTALAEIEVLIEGELLHYREAREAPVVSLSTTDSATGRDWFDLQVTVTVEGEELPFDQLFLALATAQELLVLPSGLFVSLASPELQRLRALIEEARSLQDSPSGPLKLSRFQAGLWAELEELGVVERQADGWRAAIDSLQGLAGAEIELPLGLDAELRPYQSEGYGWLARLFDGRLGGVLADDMGLGKTLQMLALFARVREQTPEGVPFLVVAPTSVVGNWVAEAARFVPGLVFASIDQTSLRRGETLASIAERADVVVTSYALFRIEYADYDALAWSALVLDEAQFVKNHQSKGYQCAKLLDTPVKFAITGTPMENNLLELWALLGLVAPGLFPSPTRFTDYYRTPIEREGNSERLAQLHRRIRPLMLRRTKEQVATDLPAKQEQVIEVELAPKHRVVYDRYLQRERRKVLGLMGDFERNRFEIFRSLTLLRRLSLDPSLVDEKHAKIPATKLDVLFELLDDVIAEGHRVLVFSQFTGFLGRVRDRLDARGVDFCYLDGSTRRRAEVIQRFRGGDAPVFLISLKAGGFGLNLTEADYCILLDPWWNPATEAQAVDRVHRIGQTKAVMVYRMVAKNTIEEKVMALKAGKAKLFDSVIDGGKLSDARLTASDIRSLLE